VGEPILEGWQEPEHQFAGTGIWTMSLRKVEALLRDSGVCFHFRNTFPVEGTTEPGRERWCSAPPRGQVTELSYQRAVLRVFVRDDLPHAARKEPPQGWDCPTY
jgi:hypothetical protein